MKNLIATLTTTIFLILTTNANAIDLGSVVQGVASDSANSIQKDINTKIDKIIAKGEKELEKYQSQLDGEIKKYQEKIAAEEQKIQKIIQDGQNSIEFITQIKDKAQFYIKIAKIIIFVFSSGILVLIFIMWRIWSNVKSFKKIVKNVANYDDIEKRLKKLEKLVAAKDN